MKRKVILFIALSLSLGACSSVIAPQKNDKVNNSDSGAIDFDNLPENDYVPSASSIEPLGTFNLFENSNSGTISYLGTFEWEACENADKYTLEFCSHPNFIADNDAIDYYIEDNIHATRWNFTGCLPINNTNYYWRVIAYNASGSRYSNQVNTFFYAAPEVEEVEFDIGEADDWTLHSVGSYADIYIDNSNFFHNNKKSLVVSFKEEDVNQGKPLSDGWVIVTRTVEKNTNGTDALSFNMYYSGKDANIFVRVIDRDNEFWHCPVQISNNAKQEVFLKFSDFTQRTGDVTVANMEFDYDRIKYMEIVFERSFGDGILLLSDVKAVKYENYKDRFIDKLDFTSYSEDQWTYEAYNFDTTKTEDELTLKFNRNGQGYGFAKINVNQYFISKGDSIKMSVKYTGKTGSNVILRIYEEDMDRWSYKIPYSSLEYDTYKELVIPYAAFASSSIMGDGRRQFSKIINIQFGLEGNYGSTEEESSISFKDFEIVQKKEHGQQEYRYIDESGLIDNFNNYDYSAQLFMSWETSYKNKDEYMQLNSIQKVGGNSNPYSGQFEYKCDMEPAIYTLPMKAKEGVTYQEFSSFKIWMKDASVKTEDPRYSHVEKYSAETLIKIVLDTDEEYVYDLGNIERVWTEYDIPFGLFTLDNYDYLPHVPNPITVAHIVSVGFQFKYFYYDIFGKPTPLYIANNPVYVDNIYFGDYSSSEEIKKTVKEKVIKMDGDIALVDDFESYSSTDDLEYYWLNGTTMDYTAKELSSIVSSEGENHSMALQYKGNNSSPNYYISPAYDQSVKGKGLRVSLYSDVEATVYVNLYVTIGTSTIQYRATLTCRTNWAEYTVGFNNFSVVSGSARTLTQNDVVNISKISFGVVYFKSSTDYSIHNLYVDNLMFDASLAYGDLSVRDIDVR